MGDYPVAFFDDGQARYSVEQRIHPILHHLASVLVLRVRGFLYRFKRQTSQTIIAVVTVGCICVLHSSRPSICVDELFARRMEWGCAALRGLFGGSRVCVVGSVGASCAASFRDARYALYVQHSYICAARALILFVCSVVLLFVARRSCKQAGSRQ